jgi:hypothetical protein
MFEGIMIYLIVVCLFVCWHLYCYLAGRHESAKYTDSQLLQHVCFVAYCLGVVFVVIRML